MTKKFIPFNKAIDLTHTEMLQRSAEFYEFMKSRRTIREFSTEEVSQEVIDNCLKTAGTAPSGANQQPWHFVIIRDSSIKAQIREAAEEEERNFYAGRAGDTWLEALEPLGTDADKPFLEKAPILIAIFEQKYTLNDQGDKVKHYYAKESVGIATGVLISALHNVGLATLTHTPSPMNFLTKILKRPEGEKPFLLLVVGYPAEGVEVPNIDKKKLTDISSHF
ncbi:MAG: nitroreductase family protein [Candidatus Marinimicrobia bacterium]|jgi:nitroreductase|nr:nitroreductase family protein [Candidatus Neomarinimicrobiota bacterium]MBT3574866.1 nitroreductase family protein [Candidatus Neomarinimicrobiota bacterium]MBT3679751.1 nitroreductase family protein [Candidatus Neomarinimicrobiota bacterium]MBT3950854.1 nitroreductase family protein [Candidatus Neomarinimicrobiota bacterium]MBT4252445.1 nitroreductase family protein [Candidatus Neomarinimicrobiota bacterium]